MTPLPHRLRTDWVALLGAPGAISEEERRWAERRARRPTDDQSDLGAPLVWVDATRSCLVAAWARDELGSGSAWHHDDRGLTLVRGQLRREGEGWTEPGTWSSEVHRRLHRGGTDLRGRDPFDGLVGDGSIVTVDAGGRGSIGVDRSGASMMFSGRADGLVVLGSDAELVADATVLGRSRPGRDPMATAWLCHTDAVVGPTTGFTDASAVPFGASFAIEPDREPRLMRHDPWLEPIDSVEGTDALVEHIRRTVSEELEASFGLADRPVIELTGGKDSRMVLAVALASGDIGRFTALTVGGPDLADVRIASQIAQQVGIEHRSGIELDAVRIPFAQKATTFVRDTGGTINAWHTRRRRPLDPEVRLSGIRGEFLRNLPSEEKWLAHHTIEDLAAATPEQIADHIVRRARRPPDRHLLHADVIHELERRTRADILADAASERAPGTLLSTFSLRRNGRTYGGPTLDLDINHRIWALSHPDALRAALQLGPDRHREEVHRALIWSASPDLALLPFAKGERWTFPGAEDRPPPPVPQDPSPDPSDQTTGAVAPSPRPRASGLIASMLSTPNDERRTFLTECLDDAANPVWEVADRSRSLASLARLDDLTVVDRKQLYAVATGALWMAQ